jgi:hypothetical protein
MVPKIAANFNSRLSGLKTRIAVSLRAYMMPSKAPAFQFYLDAKA